VDKSVTVTTDLVEQIDQEPEPERTETPLSKHSSTHDESDTPPRESGSDHHENTRMKTIQEKITDMMRDEEAAEASRGQGSQELSEEEASAGKDKYPSGLSSRIRQPKQSILSFFSYLFSFFFRPTIFALFFFFSSSLPPR